MNVSTSDNMKLETILTTMMFQKKYPVLFSLLPKYVNHHFFIYTLIFKKKYSVLQTFTNKINLHNDFFNSHG